MSSPRNHKVLTGLTMASSLAWMSILPATAVFAQSAPTVTPGSVTLSGPIHPTNGRATFTASATDPGGTPEYQFWVESPTGQWTDMQNYSTNHTFTLSTPSAGDYLVAVEVMDQAQVAAGDWNMAQTTLPDAVFNGSTVSVASSASGEVAKGQSVALTATATGIFGALYQFWYQAPDGTWTQSGSYQSSRTFTFTAGQSGTYRYVAYVKSPLAANNPHGALESNVGSQVAYGTAAQVVVSPSTQTVVADGQATGSVTYTVEDRHGDRVANFSGMLGISNTGGLHVPHGESRIASSATVTDGQATVAFSVPTADAGGSVSLVAGNLTTAVGSAGGVSGQSLVANVNYANATATVSAAAPVAAGLFLTSNVSGLSNNAMNTAMITASVVDQAGDAYRPASNTYYADLTLTGSGSFSATSTVTSDVVPLDPGNSGTYTVPVYTAQRGSGTVTVNATPVSGDPLAPATPVGITLYEAGNPTQLAISSSMGLSATGLTYTTYTVTVEDASGNVASTGSGSGAHGSTLSVSTTSGNLEMGAGPNNLAAASSLANITITNGVGHFTVENTTYQSSPATLTVTDTNTSIAVATATYTYMVGAPGYGEMLPVGSDNKYGTFDTVDSVLPGQSVVLRAQLTDQNGNPVATPGQPLWFTLLYGQVLALPNHASVPSDTYEAFTNPQGIATITATVNSVPAGQSAQVRVSGRAGGYLPVIAQTNRSYSQMFTVVSPSAYPSAMVLSSVPARTLAGTVLEGTVSLNNALGVDDTYGVIQVTSSNPRVLAVQSPISVNNQAPASYSVTALETGTATLTFTDLGQPNVPPVTQAITVVPGSATVFPLIEQNGQVLSSTNEVRAPASSPAELQVVNVDAGGNPVPVTGATSAVVALPTLPSGLYWETTLGGIAAQSGVTAAIPVGQTSANVWIVSNGTAETYGGDGEADFAVNFAGTSASADQFGAATSTSSGSVDLGAVVNPAVFQDFNGWASGSATDVTTQTALVWNSGASITAYPTMSVWAQFYFLNMAIQSSDTFTYQLGINLENPQYGYGTFLMPTLTGQG